MEISFIVITFVVIFAMFVWSMFTPDNCNNCGCRTKDINQCAMCGSLFCEHCFNKDSGWCLACQEDFMKAANEDHV